MVVGKGANTVISLIHHALLHYSFGEERLHLHTDNCSGQNKNNAMIQVKHFLVYYYYNLPCLFFNFP